MVGWEQKGAVAPTPALSYSLWRLRGVLCKVAVPGYSRATIPECDMARLARLFCPDTPHLVQLALRPASEPVAVPALDAWAAGLVQTWQAQRLAVHGWVLTPTEILMLATPPSADALRATVQVLGRVLARLRGGGPVFSGRYHSTVVEPGAWVLPSLIWLENLPVRQGLASESEYWRWSSARAHTGFDVVSPVQMHPDYWRCGNTPFDRQANYRRRLHEGLPAADAATVVAALQGQWALGSPEFAARVEQQGGRRATPRPRGRPRRSGANGAA